MTEAFWTRGGVSSLGIFSGWSYIKISSKTNNIVHAIDLPVPVDTSLLVVDTWSGFCTASFFGFTY